MRNRLSKGSKHVAFAACMLALGANFSACTDDYVLDEQKPAWLNTSIYETLESNGGYTKYLTLIADPDVNSGDETSTLIEILSRTGSNTVFVANDKAWDNFFANNAKLPKSNPWHYAQSYEQLSPSQKKLLLHTSMLNNAIVMENLASSSGNSPTRGQNLRRYSRIETVDTVTRMAVKDLPISYWSVDRQNTFIKGVDAVEVDQWSRIRDGGILGYDSIYMVLDSSLSMMVHFTNEYLAKNNITDADFRVFMGRDRITDDVHIYDALLDSADITCENGYINLTEKPLAPLANMAEIIRTNGRTNIYSHMLDRFSVPFRNVRVGTLFADLHPDKFQETDTLYTKRYYSARSYGSTKSENQALSHDERGTKFSGAALDFDPGWNGYFPRERSVQEDMGAMFVPNDRQLLDYFNNKGGKELIEEYAKDHAPIGSYNITDLETLYRDIDQIPLNQIAQIINHGMFSSFVETVPSKMISLREEVTLEPIFGASDTKLKSEGGNIDTAMMACNGVVYIMDNVYAPSDFNCVATPAFVHQKSTHKLMYWAIYSDDYLADRDPPTSIIGLNYFAYLKAMQSKFTFFMPDDEGMAYYYDPMSFTSQKPRMLRFLYDATVDIDFPISLGTQAIHEYNIETGVEGGQMAPQVMNREEVVNRIRLMLENNTIVHKNGINAINTEDDEYYLSKNGMGIKVIRDYNEKGEWGVVAAQGGFQLENEREGIEDPEDNKHGVLKCKVKAAGDYKNGWAFTLNAPLIPAARSVFSVLSNMKRGERGNSQNFLKEEVAGSNPYYQFFRLCYDFDPELVIGSGLVDEKDPDYDITKDEGRKRFQNAIKKYQTFLNENTDAGYYPVDQNIQFFNNYRYTVFAPDNAAMEDAIYIHKLPTWESIRADYDASLETDESKPNYGNLKHSTDSARIQAKILYLTNFIRTHFADNTIFADKTERSPEEMITSSYDRDNGLFVKVTVQRVNGAGGETVLQVRDAYNKNWHEASTEAQHKNIMTCDRTCKLPVQGEQSLNGNTTVASSYAVVHLIDGVLNHIALDSNGMHHPDFTNVKEARAYVKKFAIR